jgi:hypothetical protein
MVSDLIAATWYLTEALKTTNHIVMVRRVLPISRAGTGSDR